MLSVFASVSLSYGERIWLNSFPFVAPFQKNLDIYLTSGLFYLIVISFLFYRLYFKRYDFWEELKIIIKAIFLAFTLSILYVFATKSSHEYSRIMIMLIFLNLFWIMPLGRIISKFILSKLGFWQRNIWVDGNIQQAKAFRDKLKKNWFLGYVPVKDINIANVVSIASKDMPLRLLEDRINKYKKFKKEVILVPYLYRMSLSNSNISELLINRVNLISIQNKLLNPSNLFIKKLAEIFVIILLLPIGLLIVLVLSVLIRLDSKGRVLFKHKRLGKDGKLFSCYKFRTMKVDGEQILTKYLSSHPDEVEYYQKYHKYKNDPRFTKVGVWLRKLSLDELPQVFNVLRGDMNLIGPRPYMAQEYDKINGVEDIILHVKPGITGLWQVAGRNDLSFDERVELDIWYIQNWSLWLDFVIFIKTFQVLATRRGAS
jgi:undecaprenyl-phosphate galactose phosphotransferase